MNKIIYIFTISITLLACNTEYASEKELEENSSFNSNLDSSEEKITEIETELLIEDSIIDDKQDLSPQYSEFVISDYPFDVVDAYISDQTGEPTNIRATAGGEIITQLVEGDYMLKIVDKKDRWFKIEHIDTPENSIVFGGKDAWVHGSVVAFGTRNYGEQTVNIHSKASEKSNIVDSFNDEKEVKLLDYIDNEGTIDWIKVEYKSNGNTIKGWMKREMLCGNPLTTCS
jgi:uncharacterized protein YgiM (DUF1202 family)